MRFAPGNGPEVGMTENEMRGRRTAVLWPWVGFAAVVLAAIALYFAYTPR